MSKEEMIFFSLCIRANKYKYNYGRAANKTLKEILIPSEMPLDFRKITLDKISLPSSKPVIQKAFDICHENWSLFEIRDLFTITGSKTTPLIELMEYGEGKYPYVTTQATNNGVEGFYNYHTENGNVLTVDSAVLGFCSYQPLPFSASDHVEKLIPKFELNKDIAMFLTTIINQEQYRYNYGRKCSQTRMKGRSIKLPSKNKQPDFEYMENFIKSLPYSSSL